MELMLTIAAGVVLGGLILIHRAWLLDKTMLLVSPGISAIARLARRIWAIRTWILTAVLISSVALGLMLIAAEDNREKERVNQSFARHLQQACVDVGLTHWGGWNGVYSCDGEADVSILYRGEDCSLHKLVVGGEPSRLGYLRACVKASRWFPAPPTEALFDESQIDLGDFLVATTDPILSQADVEFRQSYESCALSAWEIFVASKRYTTGEPMETLTKDHPNPHNIETAYRLAKAEGVKVPYMVGHIKYKQCASELENTRGGASLSRREARFSECAYESAIRTNILVRFDKEVPLAVTKSQLPAKFDMLIYDLYGKAQQDGIVAALEESATRLDSCIRSAEGD